MYEKKVLILSIVILLIFSIIIICWLLKSPTYYYEGVATITDYKGYKAVYAKLDNVDNPKNKNIIIYSTLFKVGDKVNVEYYKKDGAYHISKLVANIKTDEEKIRMVKIINDDRKLKEFNGVSRCNLYRNGYSGDCSGLGIIPVPISYQIYNELISPEDYIKFLSHPDLGTFKDEQIILTLIENYEVIKVQNIDNGRPKEIMYELNERILSFKSLSYGIYVIEVKFDTGDIVKYVFI